MAMHRLAQQPITGARPPSAEALQAHARRDGSAAPDADAAPPADGALASAQQ
jgi:hypothetical protein